MRNAEVIRQWKILKRIEAGRYTTSADLANEHGNWYLANLHMLSAFEYANAKADKDGTLGARYEVKHNWGDGAHSDQHGGALLPEILKWIWTND